MANQIEKKDSLDHSNPQSSVCRSGLSPGKKFFFWCLLVSISLVFSLGIGEIVLRLFVDPPLLLPHTLLGSTLRPNSVLHYKNADVDNIVETNRFGFHDFDYAMKKPEGTKRVVVIGDSYIEALQVRRDEMFAVQLTKKLHELDPKTTYEGIGIGKSGSNPIEEYLFLRYHGFSLQPDLVLLSFCMNDVVDVLKKKDQFNYDINGNPTEYKMDKSSWLPYWMKSCLYDLYGASEFIYFIRFRVYQSYQSIKNILHNKNDYPVIPMDARTQFDILKESYTDEILEGWRYTANIILKIRDECARKKIPFLLMIIPFETQFDPNGNKKVSDLWKMGNPSEKPQEILNTLGKNHGFPVADLLPYFKTIKDRPLHFEEGHWNPKGHRYAAEYVANFIRENRSLDTLE